MQKYIEDPLSEVLIQGSLPRPAELEVFLGENGIFCRSLKEEKLVGAGAAPAATALYMF